MDVGWVGTVTGVLHGLRGGTITRQYFDSTWVGHDVRDRIVRIVIRHTLTSGMPPETAEEKIMYDADGLDGMGLMGMLRGIVGGRGSIEDILTGNIELGQKAYDRLYFEASRQIGQALHEETLEVIERFRRGLDQRLQQIEDLNLPVMSLD